LCTEHADLAAVEAGHAANHGCIVGKSAVAVNLAKVGEDAIDIVQRIGPHGMPRHFGALPRREIAGDLAAQGIDALMQILELF
jgi:hypothetical protein